MQAAIDSLNQTLEPVLHVLAWILLIGGSAFSVIGAIGLLRMPDFYCRIHAAGLTDTMGATLILLGLAIHNGIDQGCRINASWLEMARWRAAATHPSSGRERSTSPATSSARASISASRSAT